jgi:hypothetical protein
MAATSANPVVLIVDRNEDHIRSGLLGRAFTSCSNYGQKGNDHQHGRAIHGSCFEKEGVGRKAAAGDFCISGKNMLAFPFIAGVFCGSMGILQFPTGHSGGAG